MMSKVSVKDSVVFVTGANRKKGIGRALVKEAIKRGAKKVYATARQISQLDELVAEFPEKVVPIELDVTNREQIQAAAEKAADAQVLINNAGFIAPAGCAFNYDEKNARKEMEVNHFGPLNLINAFSKNLIENKNGAIVNIVSIGGLYPSPEYISYCASKAAFYSTTKAVRIELMPHAVAVFGVYPGPIETGMTDGMDVKKGTTTHLANRVFDGMEEGLMDITTDALSDNFANALKTDPEVIKALKEEFDDKD